MGTGVAVWIAALAAVSESARNWYGTLRKRSQDEKWTVSEARYHLDRVFTRMREEVSFAPLILANFKEAQTVLRSVRDKYSLCIALRDQHEELKKDKYYDFEGQYRASIASMIEEHNKSSKDFPVEPLS